MVTKRQYLSVLIALLFVACSKVQTPVNNDGTMVVCAQDAKVCPDGHTVGRSGPRCEFNCGK